jgi:hypothetical protein
VKIGRASGNLDFLRREFSICSNRRSGAVLVGQHRGSGAGPEPATRGGKSGHRPRPYYFTTRTIPSRKG